MTWRIIGAVAALVSAIIHLVEFGFNGYNWWASAAHPLGTIGALFIVNGVGGIVIAILLLTWRRHWLPLLLLFGFGVLTAAGFVTATIIPSGLFGDHEAWTGVAQWVAFIAEIVAIVVAIGAAVVERGKAASAAPQVVGKPA